MTYYDKVYADLWKKLGELEISKVTRENAKIVADLGFQYRPGMSWTLLAEMLDMKRGTLVNWSSKEAVEKKVKNDFRK